MKQSTVLTYIENANLPRCSLRLRLRSISCLICHGQLLSECVGSVGSVKFEGFANGHEFAKFAKFAFLMGECASSHFNQFARACVSTTRGNTNLATQKGPPGLQPSPPSPVGSEGEKPSIHEFQSVAERPLWICLSFNRRTTFRKPERRDTNGPVRAPGDALD